MGRLCLAFSFVLWASQTFAAPFEVACEPTRPEKIQPLRLFLDEEQKNVRLVDEGEDTEFVDGGAISIPSAHIVATQYVQYLPGAIKFGFHGTVANEGKRFPMDMEYTLDRGTGELFTEGARLWRCSKVEQKF